MSNVAEKLGDQTNLRVTDSDIESWALSAVGAIERFIAERNALRERVRAQDRELSLLREHVSLMRNSYRRLANGSPKLRNCMSVKSQLRTVNLNYPKLESPNKVCSSRPYS